MSTISAIRNAEMMSVTTTHPWCVLRTKIKCEKFVRDRLQVMGIDAFVPLRKRVAKYQRKIKVYEHPLISCYTFFRLDPSRKNQILALPYVQGILRCDGRIAEVSDREMQWLQKVSGTDLEMHTETLSLEVGERVVLACGQLAGMEGTILGHRSKNEVHVALENLGLQLVIQIESSMLERVW